MPATAAAWGGSFGLVGDVHLARDVALSIQPAYVQRGTNIAFEVDDESQDSLRVRLDYAEVGVLVKILPDSGRVYFSSGLGVGFLSGATLENANGEVHERDVADLFENVDLSVAFGVGVRLPVAGSQVDVELRYAQSLVSIASEDASLLAQGLPARIRSSSFQLMAAWLFTVRR